MFNAAGGLVGVNVGGSSIANSHAEGNVSGGAMTWAGGLVGQNGFFAPAASTRNDHQFLRDRQCDRDRRPVGGGRPGRQQRAGIDHHQFAGVRHRRVDLQRDVG